MKKSAIAKLQTRNLGTSILPREATNTITTHLKIEFLQNMITYLVTIINKMQVNHKYKITHFQEELTEIQSRQNILDSTNRKDHYMVKMGQARAYNECQEEV